MSIRQRIGALRSPGLLKKHYAPKAKLIVLAWRNDAELRSRLRSRITHHPSRIHIIAHTRIPSLEAPGGVSVLPHEAGGFARALYADTVFNWSVRAELRSTLLNAYPPRYFQGILSGRWLYSSIPLAATNAGLQLMTHQDLLAGRALSADFTGSGWRTMLHLAHTPVMALLGALDPKRSLVESYADLLQAMIT